MEYSFDTMVMFDILRVLRGSVRIDGVSCFSGRGVGAVGSKYGSAVVLYVHVYITLFYAYARVL